MEKREIERRNSKETEKRRKAPAEAKLVSSVDLASERMAERLCPEDKEPFGALPKFLKSSFHLCRDEFRKVCEFVVGVG